MAVAPSFSLSKETRLQISRTNQPDQSVFTIHLFGTAVGLTNTDPLPVNLILPTGLDYVKQPVPIQSVLEYSSHPLPPFVTLRYHTSLTLPSANHLSILDTISKPALLTIDGKPFPSEKTLADITSNLGADHVCNVCIYKTSKPASDESTPTAPAFETLPQTSAKITTLDVLAYVSPTATLADTLQQLRISVQLHLQTVPLIADNLKICTKHYPVLGGAICITVLSPLETADVAHPDNITLRNDLHKTLFLPARPLLRPAMAAYSARPAMRDGGCPGRLADVHSSLKPPAMGDNTVVHLVDGSYLYCHYMQDRFNDAGWGCAYRSLQTILSWCALQNYATFEGGLLPSHADIQNVLVDIGDKSVDFVGSKDWIGANEVCYVLEKLTGLSSKIWHVSRGSEMEGKGRELANHFDEQGSPVMVGGGVLAWTILGVARNERTGKSMFLILDPHYEGEDSLSTILKKGWVKWKSADIFIGNTFYNLCLPQHPEGV